MNYSDFVEKCNSNNSLIALKNLIRSNKIDLLHSFIGLATETGEILDAFKKHLFYNAPYDYNNLVEELGDLLWYIQLAINWLNWNTPLDLSIERLIEVNVQKLRKRYPNGFEDDKALNRDLDEEQKIFSNLVRPSEKAKEIFENFGIFDSKTRNTK